MAYITGDPEKDARTIQQCVDSGFLAPSEGERELPYYGAPALDPEGPSAPSVPVGDFPLPENPFAGLY